MGFQEAFAVKKIRRRLELRRLRVEVEEANKNGWLG
jgi:hypothetical protein